MYIGSSSEEHASTNSKVITKQSSSNPIILTKKDTRIICEKLETVCNDWFHLGMAFDLEPSKLENIVQHSNNRHCLTEMIGKRFEITDSGHPVTWPYICECLRSPNVQRNDIAEEIEVEFGPFI